MLARRVVAFAIDFIIIVRSRCCGAPIFIFAFGIVTLGLGFVLYWLLPPASVIWAHRLLRRSRSGAPLGHHRHARMDLEMRTWYGAPAYFVLGAVHAVAFWLTVSFLTPFVLLVGLFNERRRLLHDMMLGTVVINTGRRGPRLRGATARIKAFDETARGARCYARESRALSDDGLTTRDPAFARHPAVLPDRALALPLSAGPEERKVFTHLVGERAGDLNDLLTHGGFRRSQSIAYRPACDQLPRLRLGARGRRRIPPLAQHAPQSGAQRRHRRRACAARCRRRSNIRCSAPISTRATATAAWPT